MNNSAFLDLTKYDVSDFENLLNTSFRQIGNTYRSKEHSSYVIKKGYDDVLRFSSYNGDFGSRSLHIYSLAKHINPSYSYSDICKLLKEPVKTVHAPKELTKNDNVLSEKSLVFSDNTTFADLQTLRYFSQKCNISDFQTLNDLGVFPIESYGKIASNRIKTPFFAYKESNFLGESLKIKDANKTIFQNKVLLKSKQKDYCFGLNYISQINNKKDIVILIVEGEDDVITINNNCKHIKAVTFGGVTSPFSKDVLSYIDNHFKGAFICFDSDNAGLKGASEMQKRHDLLAFCVNNPINANDEKCKDVSDLFRSVKQIVSDKSKHSFEFEMLLTCQIHDCINAYNTELKRLVREKVEKQRVIEKERQKVIEIENNYKKIENQKHLISKYLSSGCLNVDRYISEKKDILIDFLCGFDRVLLHANTNTGKTYFVGTLINETTFQLLGIDRIIYVVPRRLLGSDIANELSKIVNTAFIDGSANQSEIAHALMCKIVVVTMDSLTKFDNVLSSSLLVLDEIQKNESDTTFRSAPNNILERLHIPKKVLAITATPNIVLYKELGFQYIYLNSLNRNKGVRTRFVNFDKLVGKENKATYKEMICREIESTQGKCVVLLNNKTDLQIIKDTIVSKKCVLITSDTYESVLQNDVSNKEKISDFDVILCTSILDAGVNLRFHIEKFITKFDTKTYDAVQLLGRDRIGIINELVILRKTVFDFIPPKAQPSFERVVYEAQLQSSILNECQNLNNLYNDNSKQDAVKYGESRYVFFSKLNNRYETDYFALGNDCYTHPQSETDYFAALQNYDNAFKEMSIEYIDFKIDTKQDLADNLEAVTTDVKNNNDCAKQKAIELIASDLKGVANTVSKFTKNVNLKKRLEPIKGASSIEIDNETRPFAEKALSKYVNINECFEVKNTAFLGMSELDYKSFKSVLLTQIELKADPKTLTPLELKRQKATKSLQKMLTELRKKHVTSISKYIKVVENCSINGIETTEKLETLEGKLQRIFELFDFERIEKDGFLTGLELKQRWSLDLIESVFDCELPVKRVKTRNSVSLNKYTHLEDLLYNDGFLTDFAANKERILLSENLESSPF
jgi:hemerythrin-like domain-containing protein